MDDAQEAAWISRTRRERNDLLEVSLLPAAQAVPRVLRRAEGYACA